MILRDALDIRRGTAQRNKIYKGTYKIWDRNKIALEGYCKQGELPSEYQQVEYIESNGTQFINTNYYAKSTTKYTIDFQATSNLSQGIFLFGSRISSTSENISLSLGASYYVGRGNSYIQMEGSNYSRHLIEVNPDSVFLDGTKKSSVQTVLLGTATYPLYLMCMNQKGDLSKRFYGKVFNCKIYDNNILVRNFIPCYRKSDNEIGFYDIVNNVFYTNAGTGAFTKGADIPNPDNSQEIEVMEGRQVVTVKGTDYTVDLKSKNLFDGILELGGYSDNGAKYNNTDNYRNANIIRVKPNTTYTFSINGTKQKYVLLTYGLTQNFKQVILNDTGTFTTASDVYYINFRSYQSDFTSDYANLKVQLEENSTATEYEPYYDYKLAGINIDKDNLYTDKGKWYFKQNIRKMILDGNESWQIFQVPYTNKFQFYIVNNSFKVQHSSTVPFTKSNYFVGDIVSNRTTKNDIIYTVVDNNISGFGIVVDDISTIADWKTWLSTHNPEVYYITSEPIITEIPSTYTTLINQLNALYQAM